MKTFRWGLMTCLLLILVSGGVLAQTSDVPPGHWAYDAVRTLIDRGYLDVSDDGAFRGDSTVSRYDLAGVVARMLNDIEQGRVQISAAADVEMLRQLEMEFRAELVRWNLERDQLEAAHGQTQRQIAVIDEQLNNILFELEQIDIQLIALDEARRQLLSELERQAARTDAGLAERDRRLDGHEMELADLQARLTDLDGRLSDVRAELHHMGAELNDRVREFSGIVLEALEDHGVSLEAQLDQQMSAYGELEQQLRQVRARIDDELIPYINDVADRLENRLDYLASEYGAALFLLQNEVAEQLADQEERFAGELATLRYMTEALGDALSELGITLVDEYGQRLDEQASGFAAELNVVRGETGRLDQAIAELTDQLEDSRAAAEANERAWRAALEEQRQALEALTAVLDRLEQRAAADTEHLGDRLDNDVAELRAIASVLDARLTEVEHNLRTVERHTAVLTDAVMEAGEATQLLRHDLDSLRARVDAAQEQMRLELAVVQDELGALQGVLGTSEDQIARLTERVRRDLDEQLALTLHREGQLSRQLSELQSEFTSYRAKTEEELQSARNMGTLGIGAAILAVVLGLAK